MARLGASLYDRDSDLTEVAVPWKLWTEAGHEGVFATEGGATPACAPLLVDGVSFGRLGAEPEAIGTYRELEQDPRFRAPVRWEDIDPADFDALHLAGGHAPGMRQYLGSEALQFRPLWWRTAAMSPLAGRVTPTCIPAGY